MKIPTRRMQAAAAAALLTLTLTACGSGDEGATDEPSTEETQATETPTEEVSETPADDDAPAADLSDVEFTAPGTELKIGDTAVLPGDYAGNDYALEVTVTAIEPGTDADLKSLRLDATSLDAFYLKVSAKVLAGNAEGGDPTDNLRALAGDSPARQIIEFGSFEPCNGEDFESGAVGETLDTCAPFAVDKGQKVDAVAFTGGEGDPIMWK